jgi:hypothetical protein
LKGCTTAGNTCFGPGTFNTGGRNLGDASNVVDPEPFDFGQVTQGATSDSALTLAVFVRVSVGNLSVTTDFGVPAAFAFDSPIPGGLTTSQDGARDCSYYAGAATPATTDAVVGVPLCYKVVKFTPSARTAQNGTVTVAGAAGQTDSATMTGTGTGPITITPSPATFSNVGIGTASPTLTLTVKNNGLIAIDKMAYTLTGTNASQFTVVQDSLTGQSIGTATLGVKYIPTTTGGATATITVTGTLHNGAGTESQTVNLLGNGATGAAVTVAISNNGVFADTPAGAISAPLTVTVSNASGSLPTGPVLFNLTGGDFRINVTAAPLPAGTLQGTCQMVGSSLLGGNPVAGGSNCTYLVWSTPDPQSAAPARTGTLLVTASPGGSFTLPLSGTATPQLTINPTGPAATPVDLGTTIIGGTHPNVTFTITNRGASDIPPGGLTISQILSANIPNDPGLFIVDTTATNGCNAANGATRNGGTCTFKLTAIPGSLTQIGTAFSRMLVRRTGLFVAQAAQADVKATVVTGATLVFTPATDFLPDTTPRDIGVIEAGSGSHSAPVKYSLANVGGVNSGAIVAALYLHGGGATLATRFSVDITSAGSCGALGEAGLAPGATCNLMVTFTPAGTDTAVGNPFGADLVVTAANGIPTELRRWIQAEVTATATSSFLADATTNLAPSNMGLPVSGVYSATLGFHAVGADLTPGTGVGTDMATVTAYSDALDTDHVTIVGGTTSPCVAGTLLSAGNMCTLKVTFPTGTTYTPAPGWHVFTVTTTDTTATKINVFARVAQPANLVASRGTTSGNPVDFGETLIGVLSAQTQTVVITNTGEGTTPSNLSVTPSNTSIISAAGNCGGAPLAYLGTCTLAISVQPPAVGVPSSPGTVTVAGGGSTTPAVVYVAWDGVTSSLLTRDISTPTEYDFGEQAVLSTTTSAVTPPPPLNPATFTFINGATSLMTGPLAIAALSGTAADPDFVILGGTCVTTYSLGLKHGESCTVSVGFIPTALATPAKTANLTVVASPGGTIPVKLDGTAVADLSVSTAVEGVTPLTINTAADKTKSVDVGPTSISGTGIAAIKVTFANEASAPQTGLLSVALSGTNAADFFVSEAQCLGVQLPSTPLGTDRTCFVTLTFAPKAAGSRTATVTVSGSPGDSAALVLNGTGISP